MKMMMIMLLLLLMLVTVMMTMMDGGDDDDENEDFDGNDDGDDDDSHLNDKYDDFKVSFKGFISIPSQHSISKGGKTVHRTRALEHTKYKGPLVYFDGRMMMIMVIMLSC